MNTLSPCPPYQERRPSRSLFLPLRGLRHHLRCWGDPANTSAERPPLFMVHGWMDVGASFQFVVDAMAEDRFVIAPDWRGFGLTETLQGTPVDTYWFPDYLADLDALLDASFDGHVPGAQVDLLGHSMGGNVAMLYAGVRPQRIRRLVNLEGFGMPDTQSSQAPERYRRWLDELRDPATLRSYESVKAVAERLQRNDPLLPADRAAWLAAHWAGRQGDTWAIRGDPAHKHTNPVLYRKDEALACWSRIEAPVLWVEGEFTDMRKWWGTRYTHEEFEQRIAVVPHLERHTVEGSGHMLHHDQPARVAALVESFLDRA